MATVLEGYLRPAEASQQLRITPQYVVKLVKAGRLDGLITPLGTLVSQESVDRLRQEREAKQR